MPPITLTSIGSAAPGVIFQITLTDTTFVRFDACASSFDTVLNLQGTVGNFESDGTTAAVVYGYNDDGCPASTNTVGSLVHTQVSAGTYYLWLTSGLSSPDPANQGNFALTMTCFTPAPTPVGTVACGGTMAGIMPTTTARYYIPSATNANGQVIYSFTPTASFTTVSFDHSSSSFVPYYMLAQTNSPAIWQLDKDLSNNALPWPITTGTTYYLIVSLLPGTDSSSTQLYDIDVICA